MISQESVCTSLPISSTHSKLTHPPMNVKVNVKRDHQARSHQHVLHGDDQRELPRALASLSHAASVSIHPPPVHQCSERPAGSQ